MNIRYQTHFDLCAFRTTKLGHWLAYLADSRRTSLQLLRKARTFDEKRAEHLVANRNYAAPDQMVLDHLTGK